MKRASRTISLIFAALFVAASMTFASSAADVTEDELREVKVTEKTLCLPYGSDMTKVKFIIDADGYSIAGGEKQPFENGMTIDVTSGVDKDVYYNPCYKITFYKGSAQTQCAVYELSEIPSVYIGTSEGLGFVHSSKENRDKNARVLIVDGDGKTVYSDVSKGTSSELKSRGNATFNYEKKPYQLKLGKKADLFGMGEAKTWILLANYIDESGLRNDISFKIAEALELDFTPKSTFVNLYIDNEYLGLYQLTEKTQIGKSRVDVNDLEKDTEKANDGVDFEELAVDGRQYAFNSNGSLGTNLSGFTYIDGIKNPDDITGGYLIELDNIYYYKEMCYFSTFRGNHYVVKSPEFASYDQMKYIAMLFSEMEEALYSRNGKNSLGRHFSEYADVDSLVKTYMVAEMTKNWDAYVGSTFFYKDKDKDGVTAKIYSGPVWDFDNAFGNQKGSFGDNKTELWAAGMKRPEYSTFGYHIEKHAELKEKLKECCITSSVCIYDMLSDGGYIEKIVDTIYSSVAADKARWKMVRAGTRIYRGEEPSTVLGYLTDFMKQRTDGMWNYFVGANVPVPEMTTAESTTEATTAESTTEATTAISDATSEPGGESITTEATAIVTESSTSEQIAGKSGCGAVGPAFAIVPMIIAAAVIVLARKKKE